MQRKYFVFINPKSSYIYNEVIKIFNPSDIVETIYTCKCEDIYKIDKNELEQSLVAIYIFENSDIRNLVFNELSKRQPSEYTPNLDLNNINTGFDKLKDLGVESFAIIDPSEIDEYRDYFDRSLCILTVFVSKLHKSLYLKFIKKARAMGVI